MNHTIDNTILIPLLSEGEKLYHYTSAEGVRGICDNKEFWVTERSFLNDITEFQIATEVMCQMLQNHIRNDNVCSKLTKALVDKVREYQTPGDQECCASSGDYIISFSLDNDSALMWSEYSDFMGYCIEFDYSNLLQMFEANGTLFLHGKVIYDNQTQIELLEKTFENEFIAYCEKDDYDFINCWDDLDALTDEQINKIVKYLAVICSVYNMFFKKACFEGEHEYRFVFMCIHSDECEKMHSNEKQFFRIKDGVFIPYTKQKITSLDCIDTILVGPKNNSDIAVKGLQYFFANKKVNINIAKSEMPLRY